MAKYTGFITAYYEWLNLSSMPEGAVARFNDIAKKGNLTTGANSMTAWQNTMTYWGGGIGKKTPAPDPTRNDYGPDPSDKDGKPRDIFLGDDEWEKMYGVCHDALTAMDSNRDDLADNKDALAYLNTLYGPGKVFAPIPISAETQNAIDRLAELLAIPEVRSVVEGSFSTYLGTDDYPSFIENITKKKYNKDGTFRQNLQRLASTLDYNIDSLGQYFKDDKTLALLGYTRAGNTLTRAGQGIDFGTLTSGLDKSDKKPDPHKLDMFKMIYPGMLKPLYTKDKIREAFGTNGVTKSLAKALGNTNYAGKEGKNFLAEKIPDEITPWTVIVNTVKDGIDDTLNKFKDRAHHHKYMMDHTAKPISLAIVGNKEYKATDNLDTILKRADAVNGKLASLPIARDHFKFFTESLAYVKNSGMGAAFDGALRNGWQLSAIVQEVCKYAIRKGKIDEAKTTLETLAMLRFGYTTSMARADLEKINFLNVAGLSFAKASKPMEFIAKGVDWTVNKTVLAASTGITMGNNFFRRRGLLFRDGKSRTEDFMKNIQDGQTQDRDFTNTEKNTYQNELSRLIAEKANLLYRHLSVDEREAQREKLDEDIEGIEAHLSKLDKTLGEWDDKHQDQMTELMAFWNFVNKQNNWNPFGSQKAAQKRFNDKVLVLDASGNPKIDAKGNVVEKAQKDILFNQYKDRFDA